MFLALIKLFIFDWSKLNFLVHTALTSISCFNFTIFPSTFYLFYTPLLLILNILYAPGCPEIQPVCSIPFVILSLSSFFLFEEFKYLTFA